jgi:hypothetical protein
MQRKVDKFEITDYLADVWRMKRHSQIWARSTGSWDANDLLDTLYK